MMRWKVTRPRGQLTIQSCGHWLEFDRSEMAELACSVQRLTSESRLYELVLSRAWDLIHEAEEDPDSRQLVASFEEDGVPSCISFMQLLKDGNDLYMYVHIRSVDAMKLASDLSALCGIGIDIDATGLAVMIGSLHLVVREADA